MKHVYSIAPITPSSIKNMVGQRYEFCCFDLEPPAKLRPISGLLVGYCLPTDTRPLSLLMDCIDKESRDDYGYSVEIYTDQIAQWRPLGGTGPNARRA